MLPSMALELDLKVVERRIAELGITWTEVATRAGMSKQQLANMKRKLREDTGGITLSTVDRLAEALKIKPKDLLK